MKWALQNRANSKHADLIALTGDPGSGFTSFPKDADLSNFDPADRMFIAVSNAHPGKPPVLQAADSNWLGWSDALRRRGILVEFLCIDDIKRFQANKS